MTKFDKLEAENRQLTRDLVRERQLTADLKAIVDGEIMNDIQCMDTPVPYTMAGNPVQRD